jgi:alpha-1,3-mannosyltransferase
MADVNATPRHIALYRQVKDFALFDHPLSKYGPPLLLLADALLTSAILSKIACKFHFNSNFLFECQLS